MNQVYFTEESIYYDHILNGTRQWRKGIPFNNDWRTGTWRLNIGNNQNYITPFTTNPGQGGCSILVLWSTHWDGGDSTAGGLIYLWTGYDSNHLHENQIFKSDGSPDYTDYFWFSKEYKTDNYYIKVTTTTAVGMVTLKFISNKNYLL